MKKNLQEALPELEQEGIIDAETAERIRRFYGDTTDRPRNRLMIAFSIIGALLIGLGIILMISYNWDELSQTTQIIMTFSQLVAAQLLCGYVILRQYKSKAWRESASLLVFIASGAAISLTASIYQIPGNFNSFMLTWMVLTLPLIYVMRSPVTSLLFLAGITIAGVNTGYFNGVDSGIFSASVWQFQVLFLLIIPYYLHLVNREPDGNMTGLHHWAVPGVVVIMLGTFFIEAEPLNRLAYAALFSSLFVIGMTQTLRQQSRYENGFLFLSVTGFAAMLFLLGQEWMWSEMSWDINWWPAGLWLAILYTFPFLLLFMRDGKLSLKTTGPFEWAFIIMIPVFFAGMAEPLAGQVLSDLLLFGIGVYLIYLGSQRTELGLMNAGLVILLIQITTRFFDYELPMLVRGIVFVLLGAGFIAANVIMLKRKENEERS